MDKSKGIILPASLLEKLTYSQKQIISALASKPQGILSRELTCKTGVSNKADIIDARLKALLANEGWEIHAQPETTAGRQWRWSLRRLNDESHNQ
jgi:hypothetical protein